MRVIKTTAKSIITDSKLPDADCVINPYTGCAFGCSYCYASFMGRFVDEPIGEWGNYVYVKTNAVDLVHDQLNTMSAEKRQRSILLSSVTDPYQGVESKYRLTRGILEALVQHQYPGLVGILTKSPLVTRDIDMLLQLSNTEVGLTVTTTDDTVSKWLEVRAPIASRRLRALSQLSEAGLHVYAFVGPLLPHFIERSDLLDALLGSIADAGVREVYIEQMNLKQYIRQRLDRVLEKESDDVQAAYVSARSDSHREALNAIIQELLTKHGLRLRMDQVLYHNQNSESPSTEA